MSNGVELKIRTRTMKSKLLIFNWKMNPQSEKEADSLYAFSKKSSLDLVIAPPSLYLDRLLKKKSNKIRVVAQDVFYREKGAFTGEISPRMLKNMGVWGVIVGHSERRIIFKENDLLIKNKLKAVINEGLMPILCVGERKRVSLKESWNYVKNQLEKDLPPAINHRPLTTKLVVAYEPIWSIGGDKPTDAFHSEQMINKIKDYLNTVYGIQYPVLYGGSVNCHNIDAFLAFDRIDGFLVGSASLKKDEISCIIKKIINKK
jgi:triosephosphate isomerase